MKVVRLAGLSLIVAAVAFPGCGGSRGGEHAAHEASAPSAPPTPDTTPIEALRTPAGLVLKIESPTTPSPALTPSPTPAEK